MQFETFVYVYIYVFLGLSIVINFLPISGEKVKITGSYVFTAILFMPVIIGLYVLFLLFLIKYGSSLSTKDLVFIIILMIISATCRSFRQTFTENKIRSLK